MSSYTPVEIDDAELGHDQCDNTPPGRSLERQDTVIKKGMIVAYYNQELDFWLVKKVVKAGRPETWRHREGEVHQTNINIVRWNAVPDEGKAGNASSHYSTRDGDFHAGFDEVSTHILAKKPYGSHYGDTYWLIDMDDPRAQAWIDAQELLRREYIENDLAKKERQRNTPAAFRARMEIRAQAVEQMAKEAETMSWSFRQMAGEIRREIEGVIS